MIGVLLSKAQMLNSLQKIKAFNFILVHLELQCINNKNKHSL